MTVRLEPGDCLDVIPRLGAEDIVVDAVVTDPPYHLVSVARGQTPGSVAASKDVFRRVKAGGFMGQQWDGGDIAFQPETWATIASILRPGGFLLAFGGTRTHHRVWCAIEDAGFVIQDTIMWVFGSGFPKRHDMLKPAFEPICVAYKPGGKRTLQVDECRIKATARPNREIDPKASANGAVYSGRQKAGSGFDGGSRAVGNTDLGRWPANLVHDGSDEVLALFPQSAASAERRYGDEGASDFALLPGARRSDGGSAARFFYEAKADKEDRWGSRHPTVKPISLMKWLVPLVTPAGGTVLDPFAGSGTTGVAALATGRNAILIEREPSYIADIRERLAFYEGEGRHSLAAKARARQDTTGPLL